MSGRVETVGDVIVTGRLLHIVLWDQDGNLPLFATLIMPGPPASALCGILSGAAFVAHAALPSASRFLAVRVTDTAGLAASNRYVDPAPGFLTADLAGLGVKPREARALDDLAGGFFAEGAASVTPAMQEAFTELLDPEEEGQGALPSSVPDRSIVAARRRRP